MIYVNGMKILDEFDKQPNWNLLVGTQDFSGPWTYISKANNNFFNFSVINYFNNQWGGICQYCNVTPGIYTFSVYARDLKGDSSDYIMSPLNQVSETTPDGKTVSMAKVDKQSEIIKLSNEWQKFKTTFRVINAGAIKPRIETSDKDRQIQLAGFKLEHGSIATPWMPAIADLMLKNQNGGVRRPANPLISMPCVPSLEMGVA